jgi:NADH dehydrogenase FAD-containing subunit
MASSRRTVALVGAGHAHLHIIANAHVLHSLGARLLVINPGDFWYSGLATGMLGGMYSPEEDRIDVSGLVARCDGRFLRDRVVGLDPPGRRLTLASGQEVRYDVASLNIGSEPDPGALRMEPGSAWTVKPISRLAHLRRHCEERLGQGGLRAVVIGGGPTGCEVAANLWALGRRHRGTTEVTLLSGSHRLLPDRPRGASRAVANALRKRGVRIVLGSTVVRVEPRAVHCSDGTAHRTETVVLATGLRAPSALRHLGLACSPAGLRVDRTLRAVQDPHIFGAGDCIDFDGRDLPKLGVFGVRQAPVLLRNLAAALTGGRMSVYRPQRRRLMILNLGEGDALATRGRLWWRGRLAMRLKEHLDLRFLDRYRNGAGPSPPR